MLLILLHQLIQIQVPIGEIHDILKSLFADRCEILRRFQLVLVDNEVEHHLLLVAGGEFTLVNRVHQDYGKFTNGVDLLERCRNIGIAQLQAVLDFSPLYARLEYLLIFVQNAYLVLVFLLRVRVLHNSNYNRKTAQQTHTNLSSFFEINLTNHTNYVNYCILTPLSNLPANYRPIIILTASTMDPEDPFAIFEQPLRRTLPPSTEDEGPRKIPHLEEPAPVPQIPEEILLGQEEGSEDEAAGKRLQQIEIETIREESGCLHEVYYPKDYTRTPYKGELNAKKYPFKLDPFQSKAVTAIESDQSVLVCAHTSAGKTAIAEYAIALSLKRNSRVIYTSPIKALSNQKYRELKQEFEDVGLITGDVAIDQGSTCLVMTTEILRNMIYRGSEIVREVKWVIFDEVHYMRDKERGVVWEETIIMLPSNVKYVFLSATIGNPGQFAMWITKLRKQPCNVVYTDYRPVPLEHYLCPAGGEGLFLAVDDKGKFHDDNFNKALQALGDSGSAVGVDKKKKNLNQGSDLSKIIKTIIQRGLDPVIIFSFSKKDVESYAKSICLKYDLTNREEKERIDTVYNRSLMVLDEKDRQLPAIQAMRDIVKKGVGIHHGGLLPLVKEVVELLFQDGLLKVLFSTETFSMGLNMPARTVVFTNVKKFDGQKSRWITGGEYIQMSGRAGRRGLDKKGTTILMFDQKMQTDIAKTMLKGHSDNLLSSFYLGYHMLLNSQRLEDIDVEYILARSLLQFQQDAQIPALKADYAAKQEKYKGFVFEAEQDMESLFAAKTKLDEYKQALRKIVHTPQRLLPFLNIGRIIRLVDGSVDWGYGISLNFHKKDQQKKNRNEGSEAQYLIDSMVYIKPKETNPIAKPASFNEEGEMSILQFSLSCVHEVLSLKISNLPSDLQSAATKNLVKKTLSSVSAQIQPPVVNIDANQPEAIKLKVQIATAEKQIANLRHLEPRLQEYGKKKEIYQDLKKMSREIKEKSGLVLSKEMKAYNRVIKRAGLVDKGVVTLKGRVTCQINSHHEILLTDLIFSGFFNDMSPIEIASILSSLVHEEKSTTERLRTKMPRLRQKLQQLITRAKTVFLIFKECKMTIEEQDYIDSIKEQLIEMTFDWCSGSDFETILKKTDSYEGSIIRTLRRLHELLKDMSTASKEIGNEELSNKFIEASNKVNRGIVVSASLYVL